MFNFRRRVSSIMASSPNYADLILIFMIGLAVYNGWRTGVGIGILDGGIHGMIVTQVFKN
ncbi:MAG: hypothetical protein ACYCZO_05350 [Daejeonella sp.]